MTTTVPSYKNFPDYLSVPLKPINTKLPRLERISLNFQSQTKQEILKRGKFLPQWRVMTRRNLTVREKENVLSLNIRKFIEKIFSNSQMLTIASRQKSLLCPFFQ